MPFVNELTESVTLFPMQMHKPAKNLLSAHTAETGDL